MVRRAVCCCGDSFIEVEGDPVINAICHCENFRRRTGTAFGWSSYFPENHVLRRQGHFREYAIGGGNPQQRWFCETCGSTLLWKTSFMPDHIGIAGGCFVEPRLPEPTVTVTHEKRFEWLGLPAHWRTSLKTEENDLG
jgi:hypothetical protein